MAYTVGGVTLNRTDASFPMTRPVDAEVHQPIGATVATVTLNTVGGVEADFSGHATKAATSAATLLALLGTTVTVDLDGEFEGEMFILSGSVEVLAAGAGYIFSGHLVEVTEES